MRWNPRKGIQFLPVGSQNGNSDLSRRLPMRKSLIVLVTLVLGLTTRSCANVTAVSSQVFLQASSQADLSCSPVVNSNGQSQGATLNPLSASVSALSQCNGALVNSFADVAATFASANAGSIGFGNIGWSTSNVSLGSALPYLGLDYNYSFFANANRSEEHTSELQSLKHLVCRL